MFWMNLVTLYSVSVVKVKCAPLVLRPSFIWVDPFDMKFDLYLFLKTITVIGEKKSRDIFQPYYQLLFAKTNEHRTTYSPWAKPFRGVIRPESSPHVFFAF